MSSQPVGATVASAEASLTMRIVEAIAEAKGVPAEELDPVHDHVDLEALEAVVASADADLYVRWSVDGHEVEVDGTGAVRVF